MEPPQKDNGDKKMWNCSLRIEVPPPRAGQNAMKFDGWGFGKWSFTAASLGWAVAEQEKLPWAFRNERRLKNEANSGEMENWNQLGLVGSSAWTSLIFLCSISLWKQRDRAGLNFQGREGRKEPTMDSSTVWEDLIFPRARENNRRENLPEMVLGAALRINPKYLWNDPESEI